MQDTLYQVTNVASLRPKEVLGTMLRIQYKVMEVELYSSQIILFLVVDGATKAVTSLPIKQSVLALIHSSKLSK